MAQVIFPRSPKSSRSVCKSGCMRDRGEEEDGELQVEVESEDEENQRGRTTCATWREDDRLANDLSHCSVTHD